MSALTPEAAVAECDRLLRLIEAAQRHPRIPPGKHARRPPPAGFEPLYARLLRLYEDPAFASFAEPVNAVELGIPHYFATVQNPKSLRDILDDVVEGKFRGEDEVLAAVQLIRDNSVRFNGVNHHFTQIADRMLARLLDELRVASVDDVKRMEDMLASTDEETMQRAFHAIKTEAPHLVRGDDMVDTANLHVGLINDIINMIELAA